MEVDIKLEGQKATVLIEGRIDSSTAPELEKKISKVIKKVNDIVLDFEKVEYITSAGLRVILAASKALSEKGKLLIINTSDVIKEIFDMTGFSTVVEID